MRSTPYIPSVLQQGCVRGGEHGQSVFDLQLLPPYSFVAGFQKARREGKNGRICWCHLQTIFRAVSAKSNFLLNIWQFESAVLVVS